MIIWAFAVVFAILLVFNLVGFIISAPKYKGPESDHFNGKVFTNPRGVKAKGLKDVIKWSRSRNRQPWKELTNISFGPKPLNEIKVGVKVTFVNHSTFLIQVKGVNILTDPIWSKHTSPVQFAGPKRMRPPGILFDDLPRIDYVLLSHNHYDHLDKGTMKKLIKIHDPLIITPLGVGKFIQRLGSRKVTDLDWWDEHEMVSSLKVASVPTQHFSGRGTYDRDATLWCGYVIMDGRDNIYFAGDSGYGNFFKEIGSKYGKMKVSMIPIGAYLPRWFMSPIHISPDEAVKVHRDVNSELSIAMHFGTFPLADDGQNQPIVELGNAVKAEGIDEHVFKVLNEGESILVQ